MEWMKVDSIYSELRRLKIPEAAEMNESELCFNRRYTFKHTHRDRDVMFQLTKAYD